MITFFQKRRENAEYREGYKKAIIGIAIGAKDLHGEEIINIYTTADDYIVYEVKDTNPSTALKVCVYTKDPNDTRFGTRYHKILPRYIQAKALLHKVDDPAITRSRIANIMSHALAQDVNQAEQLFDQLIKDINSEFNDRIYNKLTFLFSNVIVSSILATLSIWRYESIIGPNYQRHHFDILTTLLFVLTCASIGGAFSLSAKLKNLATTKSVKWPTYVFYGLERTFIAMSAGFIFFLAISAHLIFASLVTNQDNEQHIFILLFLSILAGFSETLVPDLLVTLEKNKGEQEKKQ